MIKLLIVDDSALMRRQLTLLFQAEGDFDIRQARNGVEAVEENRNFQPDVVTLDINMPEMDGITALSLIMTERPVSVIMVSSLTEKGALATFEALNLGAIDYVAKPGGTISLSLDLVKKELVDKVRAAARIKNGKTRLHPTAVAEATRSPSANKGIQGLSQHLKGERLKQEQKNLSSKTFTKNGLLLIGVSTGGPRALEEILPQLPEDFPWPVLISQHMPASFTAPFAARLNALCPLQVVEVFKPMPVETGTIYIGKGGADMVVVRRAETLMVVPKPESAEHLWHPSVELMGSSALEHVDAKDLVGVILTGMGYDGADSFAEIKKRGGKTIAESEDTAVVFGMPAELIKRKGASLVLPLDKIALQIKAWVKR